MGTKIGGLWSIGLAGMIAASAGRAAGAQRDETVPVTPVVESRETRVSEVTRLRAEAQLDSCVAEIEKTVRRQGESVVAARMSHELGVAPADLINEHAALDCFLGDLLIAHSLLANASSTLTARQLIALHDRGSDWTEIAMGLGLKLSHVVRGLINETRVAAGLSRGDGKVAVMKVEASATLASSDLAGNESVGGDTPSSANGRALRARGPQK